MRILQYLPGLPPVLTGGMIKYALDLVQGEIHAGHEVIMLVPGQFTFFHTERTRIIEDKWNGGTCYKIINPLPVSGGKGILDITKFVQRGNKKLYIRFLKKIKPDVIHIHSFMGLHIAFLEAAMCLKISVVYTTHDYYGLCPKAILLKGTRQCMVIDGTQCSGCIERTTSLKRLQWQQSRLYTILKNNKLINYLEYSQNLIPIKIYIRSILQMIRQKSQTENSILKLKKDLDYKELQSYYQEMFTYITRLHYNSIQSKEVFEQHLGNLPGEVISISNKNIVDRRKQRNFGKTLRIGFIGREMYKGFELLKDVLQSIYAKGKFDFECHVYFNPKEKLPPYIVSHAPYKEEDMRQVYDGMDVLVLLSLWKETYGLVVLEALSLGVPVIISQNVGAKELLEMHSGIGIVVELNKESVQNALEKVYENRRILEQMNLEICNCNLGLNYEEHVGSIIGMYNGLLVNNEKKNI